MPKTIMSEPISKRDENPRSYREVVAVFQDAPALEAAADALDAAGFPQTSISIMADERSVARKLGHRFQPIRDIEDDGRVPRRTFVGKADRSVEESAAIGLPLYVGAMAGAVAVVASGGALAMALVAAAAGGAVGGGLGAVLARFIGQREADRLEANIRGGGILLWVSVSDPAAEARAIQTLTAAGGTDVHAHDIAETWQAPEVPFDHWNPDPFLLRA